MFDYSSVAIPKPPPRIKKLRRRIRHESAKHRAGQREWNRITQERIQETGGLCMVGIYKVCTLKATDGHHKRPRSRGGKHTRENCIPCCRPCHDWIADNRLKAIELGWLE